MTHTQADHFIFHLGDTYVATVPVVAGAFLGNRSTLHQDHVDIHQEAFRSIDKYVKDLQMGLVQGPDFLNTNKTLHLK